MYSILHHSVSTKHDAYISASASKDQASRTFGEMSMCAQDV